MSCTATLSGCREDLGICDTWKENILTRDIDILTKAVYALFSRFIEKRAELKIIVKASKYGVFALRPSNEVRWL